MKATLRRISLFLTLVMILLCVLPACTDQNAPKIDPETVWSALLYDITYAGELKASKNPSLSFEDMPDGVEIRLFSVNGYLADEAIMIIVKDRSDLDKAKTSAEKHVADKRASFASYIPDELPKFDHAVIRTGDTAVFVSVTNDYLNAASVLDKALSDPDYKPKLIYSAETESEAQSGAETTSQQQTGEQPASGKMTEAERKALYNELYGKRTDVALNEDGYPKLTSASGKRTTYSSGVFRVDDAAFEPYSYSESAATAYASAVNRAAAALKGTCTVYDMLIPTSYGITIPDDIKASMTYNDQNVASQKIYSKLDSSVVALDLYPALMNHRDEYLFFRTDTHWAQLGAYYAYSVFCYQKGIHRIPISDRRVATYEPFLGYFYWSSSNQDKALRADQVYAYYYVSENARMKYTDKNGNVVDWPIIADGNSASYPENKKYLIFAGTDNPYTEFTNPDITDGSVCIFVKESFGNCFVPFLVDHYQTVYEIDYRYWTGELTEFAKEVNATDLIFANNLSMTRSSYLVGLLDGIVK